MRSLVVGGCVVFTSTFLFFGCGDGSAVEVADYNDESTNETYRRSSSCVRTVNEIFSWGGHWHPTKNKPVVCVRPDQKNRGGSAWRFSDGNQHRNGKRCVYWVGEYKQYGCDRGDNGDKNDIYMNRNRHSCDYTVNQLFGWGGHWHPKEGTPVVCLRPNGKNPVGSAWKFSTRNRTKNGQRCVYWIGQYRAQGCDGSNWGDRVSLGLVEAADGAGKHIFSFGGKAREKIGDAATGGSCDYTVDQIFGWGGYWHPKKGTPIVCIHNGRAWKLSGNKHKNGKRCVHPIGKTSDHCR